MSAPDQDSVLRSMPCPDCARNLPWYERSCKHCGYDTWIGDAEREAIRAEHETGR